MLLTYKVTRKMARREQLGYGMLNLEICSCTCITLKCKEIYIFNIFSWTVSKLCLLKNNEPIFIISIAINKIFGIHVLPWFSFDFCFSKILTMLDVCFQNNVACIYSAEGEVTYFAFKQINPWWSKFNAFLSYRLEDSPKRASHNR